MFHCEKPNGGEDATDNYVGLKLVESQGECSSNVPLSVVEETNNIIDQNDSKYSSASNSNVIDFVNPTEMEEKDQEESATAKKGNDLKLIQAYCLLVGGGGGGGLG